MDRRAQEQHILYVKQQRPIEQSLVGKAFHGGWLQLRALCQRSEGWFDSITKLKTDFRRKQVLVEDDELSDVLVSLDPDTNAITMHPGPCREWGLSDDEIEQIRALMTRTATDAYAPRP